MQLESRVAAENNPKDWTHTLPIQKKFNFELAVETNNSSSLLLLLFFLISTQVFLLDSLLPNGKFHIEVIFSFSLEFEFQKTSQKYFDSFL